MKAAYGIAIPNFLIAGSLYSHTAAKLFFVRIFRKSAHLHEHTILGWGTWTILIILMNGAAFVLAVGVPVRSSLFCLAFPSPPLQSSPSPLFPLTNPKALAILSDIPLPGRHRRLPLRLVVHLRRRRHVLAPRLLPR